jgi:secondary thiamine-phosphate synthase enzyme
MRSYREELWFNTPTRVAFVRITDQVAAAVRKSGVREGLCLVNAMHITASVFVNDNESGLWHDFERWLEKLAPHAPVSQYRHNDTGEDNADAHLKRTIMGREVVLAITDGKARPWTVGRGVLRRVRRSTAQARTDQNYWGVDIREER